MTDLPATSPPLPRRRWQVGLPHLFLLMTCLAGGLAQVRELGLNGVQMRVVMFGTVLFVILILLPGIACALFGMRFGRPEWWGAVGGGIAGAAYAGIVPLTRGFDPSLSTYLALALLGPLVGWLSGVGVRQEATNAALDIGWPAAREKYGRRGTRFLAALLYVWLACIHLAAYSSAQDVANYRHEALRSVWEFIGPSLVALPILVGCVAVWAALGRRWFALRIAMLGGLIALGLALPHGDLALLFGVQALLVAAAARLVVRWQRRDDAPRLAVLLLTDVLPLVLVGILLRILAFRIDRAEVIDDKALYPAVLVHLGGDEMARGAALAGFYLAVLTLAAAWAVHSRKRRWLRVAALLTAVAWVGDSLISLNHGAARMPTYGAALDDLGWWWFVVAIAIALATAGWVGAWRFATQPPAATGGSAPPRTVVRRVLRPAVACLAAALLAAIAVPPARLYSRLAAWPVKATGAAPPAHAGADDGSAVMLADRAVLKGMPHFATPEYEEERTAYLVDHQAELDIARAAANGADSDFDDRLIPNHLVHLLRMAGEEAAANDDFNAALDYSLDALRFAHPSSRGDTLGGLASKSGTAEHTINRLGDLTEKLTSQQRHKLLAALEELDAKEPNITAAERITLEPYYNAGADHWRRRLDYLLIARVQPRHLDPAYAIEALKCRQAAVRLLMCELAVDQYYDERGRLPAALSDLVPEYLPSVPQDPFGTAPFVYRTTKRGCLIYSIGTDEFDEGGVLTSILGFGGDYGVEYVPPMPAPR